jgi:hypothetical protein
MADDLKSPAKAPAGPITPTAIQPPRPDVAPVETPAPAVADDGKPVIPPAPPTVPDPSRAISAGPATSFPGYPKTVYNPRTGARVVNDPNEEAQLPGPKHNWFATAEEADMHRTDNEAMDVVSHNRRVKVDAALSAAANNGEHDLSREVVTGDAGVVRNSVAATESLKAGNAEPL